MTERDSAPDAGQAVRHRLLPALSSLGDTRYLVPDSLIGGQSRASEPSDPATEPSASDAGRDLGLAEFLEVLLRMVDVALDRSLEEQLVGNVADETTRQVVVKLKTEIGAAICRIEHQLRRSTSTPGRGPLLLDEAS